MSQDKLLNRIPLTMEETLDAFDWYSEGQSAFYHILRGEDWRDGSNIGG